MTEDLSSQQDLLPSGDSKGTIFLEFWNLFRLSLLCGSGIPIPPPPSYVSWPHHCLPAPQISPLHLPIKGSAIEFRTDF